MVERVQLAYEVREGRWAWERVPTAAVALSAGFVAVSVWAWVPWVTGDRRVAGVVATWVVVGLVAGGMVAWVWRRVKGGRTGETRAGWWAMLLLLGGGLFGGSGVVLALIRPQPRVEYNWAVCNSHMKEIGSAILLYSNENHGQYPERLGQLVLTQDITGDAFVCPQTNDDSVRGPTTRVVADGLAAGGHLSYVYVGAGLTSNCDRDTVVLFEPMANHAGDGVNVLFGDGRVEFLDPRLAREILDRVAMGERPVVWRGPGVRMVPTTQGQ